MKIKIKNNIIFKVKHILFTYKYISTIFINNLITIIKNIEKTF